DIIHASASAGSIPVPVDRYSASPSSAPSQPTPAAPGPYVGQLSSSTWATCSSSKRVPPAGSGDNRTSIQLTSPPNSQVAPKLFGGSQRSIVPSALPCSW